MRGIGSVFTELGLHPPFGRLVPQPKAQLVVKPACPLLADRPTLTQQKNVYTVISVAHARLADLLGPLLQRRLLTAPGLVVTGGAILGHGSVGIVLSRAA